MVRNFYHKWFGCFPSIFPNQVSQTKIRSRIVSESYQNYRNGAVSNQVTDMRREPLFKIIRWKIHVVTTESILLWVDSKSRLTPWIQCSIHEKGTGLRGFFKKRRLFMEIVTMKNEEGRPYSFAPVSVQKIRKIDTKGVES
jgi:hypothetical protein